jgi:uncharacterized protein (DUF1778 family)
MGTTTRNDARVDFRLPSEVKSLIEEAAALAGQSLSEFAVSTLLAAAHRILDASRVRTLTARDARIFLAALDSDEGPNQALREAAAWYKENHGGPVDG